MSVRLTFLRMFILCASLCVLLSETSQGQQSVSEDKADTSSENPFAIFNELRQMVSPEHSGADALAAPEESRDPTAPTERILDYIPKPPPVVPLTPKRSVANQRVPAFVPLPTLPKITLRGLVLSEPDRGTATLDVDGRSVSISLLPREKQQRVPIPKTQFAAMKTALDQRAALAKGTADDSGSGGTDPSYEMCLRCSLIAGGVVFNLEAFTPEVLLLRAVPHDELILVRRGSP